MAQTDSLACFLFVQQQSSTSSLSKRHRTQSVESVLKLTRRHKVKKKHCTKTWHKIFVCFFCKTRPEGGTSVQGMVNPFINSLPSIFSVRYQLQNTTVVLIHVILFLYFPSIIYIGSSCSSIKFDLTSSIHLLIHPFNHLLIYSLID